MWHAARVSVSGIQILGHTVSPLLLQRAMAVEIIGGSDIALSRLTVIGGVRVTGGERHTLTRSDVSNPHGSGGGHCVYFSAAGHAMTLTRSDHIISHSEVHRH